MNDLLRLAMEQAAELFDHNGNLFCAAGLSDRLTKMGRLDACVDGKLIRVLLTGRPDVIPLPDGSMYQLLNWPAQ